ncbi:MAG: indole-3-glycerol phosphate synthase TrpC [Gammaproteobacteria bacterium]|nr:indole-3-glycerol phosphate synthase TrpC [Gammaproteobacteria bacterium]
MSNRDILKEIVATKFDEVAAQRARVPLDTLEAQLGSLPPTRGFARAITTAIEHGHAAVIAECKRASPSKGVIREDYDPAAIAAAYARGGATCLSVLTDKQYFKGSPDHLKAAREACALPVLRKDFMVDPYQIIESRVMGADCILLIAACLNDATMAELARTAQRCGLDVLVEVHNREELERAHVLRTPLIGINNRDLRTFRTDIETTLGLLPDVFPDRTVITESGIHSADQVRLLRSRGVHGFLVGEAFMSSDDPGARLKQMFGS